ncbi:hypothetical protein CEXT_326471 [Caerostris extrusa]|uniref:Uncharacterized protein n=1 Tax=Caerostris extrusa TaxID=172846 RepID=A0AAV4NFI6_CAEEX|nr:hypothetical protein CEXT_326471 [Caerostris extrusa]
MKSATLFTHIVLRRELPGTFETATWEYHRMMTSYSLAPFGNKTEWATFNDHAAGRTWRLWNIAAEVGGRDYRNSGGDVKGQLEIHINHVKEETIVGNTSWCLLFSNRSLSSAFMEFLWAQII